MAQYVHIPDNNSGINIGSNFNGFGLLRQISWCFGAWIRTNNGTQDILTCQVPDDQSKNVSLIIQDNRVAVRTYGQIGFIPAGVFSSNDRSSVSDGNWHYVGVAIAFNGLYSKFRIFFFKDGVVTDSTDSRSASSGTFKNTPEVAHALSLMSGDNEIPFSRNLSRGKNRHVVKNPLGDSHPVISVKLNGDISYILSSAWLPWQLDANAAGAVASWFRCYYKTGPGAIDFNRDAVDAFCPFYDCLGPNVLNNVVNNAPATLQGAANIGYDTSSFLDGFSELSLYSKSGAFQSVNVPAFTWIMQQESGVYSQYTVDDVRKLYKGNNSDALITIQGIISRANYKQGSTFSEDEFNQTKTAVIVEIEAVLAVRSYCNGAQQHKEVMLILLEGALNSAKVLFDSIAPPSHQAEFDLSELFGLICDAVTLIEPESELAVFAFKAIWFIGNLKEGSDQIPDTDTFTKITTRYDQLMAQIQTNFVSDINNIWTITDNILSDGGKIAAAAALVRQKNLSWPDNPGSFSPDVQKAAMLGFVQTLMVSLFSIYTSSSFLRIDQPCVQISASIPSRFMSSGFAQYINMYWAAAIGIGSSDEITIAPTEEIANFIFDDCKVQDFWKWPFTSIGCGCNY